VPKPTTGLNDKSEGHDVLARRKRAFMGHLASRHRSTVVAAKALYAFDQAGGFLDEGCASPGEFGARNGFTADEARELWKLGRAIAHVAALELEVLSGRISSRAASRLDRVFSSLGFAGDWEDWLALARTHREAVVSRRIDAWVERVALGDAIRPLLLHVTQEAYDDFDRARTLVSRTAQRILTEGEVFGVVVGDYVRRHDPRQVGEGGRRVGDTCEIAGRYVPATVRRAVMLRTSDCCAVPGCPNKVFLDFAHVRAHRDGGSREVHNLFRFCSKHHRMFDEGLFTWTGTVEEPVFVDMRGRVMTGPPPESGDPAPRGRPWERAKADAADAAKAASTDDADVRAPSWLVGSADEDDEERRSSAPPRRAGDAEQGGDRRSGRAAPSLAGDIAPQAHVRNGAPRVDGVDRGSGAEGARDGPSGADGP